MGERAGEREMREQIIDLLCGEPTGVVDRLIALIDPLQQADVELGRVVEDHEADLASIADCVNVALRECERGGAQIASWTAHHIKGAIDQLVYENTGRRLEIARLKARVEELESDLLEDDDEDIDDEAYAEARQAEAEP